jgi:hypothetical protein
MKTNSIQAALGSALVLLHAGPASASHSHNEHHFLHAKRHAHRHHGYSSIAESRDAEGKVQKRATCTLPTDPDITYITGGTNAGWAIPPDRECHDGMFCPYACAPGKVMNQWKPGTGYHYPESMDGGLYCDGGTAKKPFDGQPYCVDGTGTVTAVNTCGKEVAFCQTTLPGDESMVIPTSVKNSRVIAVPGISYWASTAAQ